MEDNFKQAEVSQFLPYKATGFIGYRNLLVCGNAVN